MNFHGNNGQANQTSVHLVNDTNQKEEDTSILYSSSVEVRTNVLLKTAVAPVWSDHSCRDTHILFDEGAQRSFVTEDLARNLIYIQTELKFYNYRHVEIETKTYNI